MFIPVLFALAIVAFYSVFTRIFNVRLQDRIRHANNVKEAVDLRKKLAAKREKILMIFFSVAALALFVVGVVYPPYMFTNLVVVAAIFVILWYDKSKVDLVGNISYSTPEEFLETNDRFYLYLRGFSNDVPFEKRNEADDNGFSESLFAEVVDDSLGIPICALGLMSEVDSPVGAKRVYVEDENWKEKVLELMEKAEKIFILINNRKSCIWEIGQVRPLLEKTVFIVDSVEDYVAVKELFAAEINMPELSSDMQIPFFFDSGIQPVPFENTDEGYLALLGIDAETFEESRVTERKAKMLADSGKDVVVAIFTMLAIIAFFAVWIGLSYLLQNLLF